MCMTGTVYILKFNISFQKFSSHTILFQILVFRSPRVKEFAKYSSEGEGRGGMGCGGEMSEGGGGAGVVEEKEVDRRKKGVVSQWRDE